MGFKDFLRRRAPPDAADPPPATMRETHSLPSHPPQYPGLPYPEVIAAKGGDRPGVGPRLRVFGSKEAVRRGDVDPALAAAADALEPQRVDAILLAFGGELPWHLPTHSVRPGAAYALRLDPPLLLRPPDGPAGHPPDAYRVSPRSNAVHLRFDPGAALDEGRLLPRDVYLCNHLGAD